MIWRRFAIGVGHWMIHGFGFFTVLEKASGAVIGSVGTQHPLGWPGTEVGWVIGKEYWRKGYGKEAATAAINHAFDTLGWKEVIHFIEPANFPSIALAKSLGSRYLRDITELEGYGEVEAQIWGQRRK
jgi:RimJ/RimL family protein N-acetyltransferase